MDVGVGSWYNSYMGPTTEERPKTAAKRPIKRGLSRSLVMSAIKAMILCRISAKERLRGQTAYETKTAINESEF